MSVLAFDPLAVPRGPLFTLTLPADTFVHRPDGQAVVMEARLLDGQPLPAWLSFDNGARRFVGKPPEANVDSLEIQLIARDAKGVEATTRIKLMFVSGGR